MKRALREQVGEHEAGDGEKQKRRDRISPSAVRSRQVRLTAAKDDHAQNRQKRAECQAELKEIEDGLEALHLLRAVRHRAPASPCLVLLDLKMPRLGGPEFRRAQLGDPTVANVPIAVMSGAIDVQERAAALGAVATLPKPVDVDELMEVVKKYCA